MSTAVMSERTTGLDSVSEECQMYLTPVACARLGEEMASLHKMSSSAASLDQKEAATELAKV